METKMEARSVKMFRLLDRTLQKGAWTGIILSRMVRNMLPDSMKRARGHHPYFIDDRRDSRRLRVDRTVACMRTVQDKRTAHLINISRDGMYVETDAPADVGQELSFNLSGTNLGPIMRVRGRVTRKAERGMAVRFI